MRRNVVVFCLAASLATVSGCKSLVTIHGVKPAQVNLGATKQLQIFHTEGRRSAREAIIEKMIAQARHGGYFQVQDRTEEGAEVKIAGRTASVEGGSGGLAAGQVGVRIDVLEWNSERDTKETEYQETVGSGKKKRTVTKTKTIKIVRGNVLLGVTLFDDSGKAIWAEKEIQGTAELEGNDKDAAIEQAADDAVAQILSQITPMPYQQQVELDTDDEQQDPIIELAKKGAIAQAAEDMEKYVEAHPNNAAAAYNLAVFIEASGDYQAALSRYDKALSLGNKSLYSTARAACAKRVADQQALAD